MEKKKKLNKQDIVQADDIKTESVSVPEWGGEVMLRTLTAAELDAWEFSVYGSGETKNKEQEQAAEAKRRSNFRASLCVRCIVDEKGKRVFSNADVPMLGSKSGAAVDRIFTVCQRMNALSQKDVDELEKNSVTGRDDSSPSD